LKVLSFTIRPKNPDGVIEPGETLIIENIKMSNDGGLVVPSGTRLKVLNTPFIFCEEQINLPEIPPFKTYTSPKSIEVVIRPSIPNGWKKEQIVAIHLQADILGRVFKRSCVSANFIVQYPLRIESIVCPSQIGCGDHANMQIQISNISRNHLSNVSIRVTSNAPIQFENSRMHNEYSQTVRLLSSGNTEEFSINFTMGYNVHFYEGYLYHVFLFYGQNLVEEYSATLQAVPHFNMDHIEETDALMIVANNMTKYGYMTYNAIFQMLSLKVQWWDSRLYGGVSLDRKTGQLHQASWVDKYRGKLIIIAVNTVDELIQKVNAEHITSHFDQSLYSTLSLKDETSNLEASGFIVVMDNQDCDQLQLSNNPEESQHYTDKIVRYIMQMEESSAYCEKILDPVLEFSESYRFSNPTAEHAEIKCREIEQRYEVMYPSFRYRVKVNKLEVKEITDRKLASWYKMNWKYSFGEASLYRSPITILQHFLGVYVDQKLLNSKKNGTPTAIMDDNYHKFINIDSAYFKIIYSLVSGLSIRKRLEMIKENSEKMSRYNDSEIDSVLDEIHCSRDEMNEYKLLNYMIRDTIFQDVKRELKLQDQWFFRAEKLCTIIQTDTNHNLIYNRDVVHSVIFILCRLENMSYWRSWVPTSLESYVGSLKEKREMLTMLKTNCLSSLEAQLSECVLSTDQIDELGFTYEQVMSEASIEAEQRYADCTYETDDTIHNIPKPRYSLKYLIE
jgi:hypothetical protein